MVRYLFHVGPPKAGSTYLQSSLQGMQKEMEAAGYLVGLRGANKSVSLKAASLEAALRGTPSPEVEAMFSLWNESGAYHTVILSAESLHTLENDDLVRLRALTGPKAQVEFVYNFRRWSDRLPSMWKMDVETGSSQTFPEFMVRILRDPMKSIQINAAMGWQKFTNVFGRDSLHVVSFDNLIENKSNTADFFLDHILKWRPASMPAKGYARPSAGASDAEIMRVLNTIHTARSGQRGSELRKWLLALRDGTEVAKLKEIMDRDRAKYWMDDNGSAFQPATAALMEFKDRLANPGTNGRFFTPKRYAVQYFHQNYLLLPGVAESLNRLYDTIQSTPYTAEQLASVRL